jgi:co-chaperonin GroES (HSP10)
MSKFALLHDLVLIKRVLSKTTEAGIITTYGKNSGAKGAPMEGVVVSVGPGKYTPQGDLIKVDVEPGDNVIFCQTDLKTIRQLGEDFVIVPSSEVLLRLRPEDPVVPEAPEIY